MLNIGRLASIAALIAVPFASRALALEPIHERCHISVGDRADTLRLETSESDCPGRHCGTSQNDIPASRITGLTLANFAESGSHFTATLAAEAGTFTCAGTIAENELTGSGEFRPNAEFVSTMGKMGFTGYTSEKLVAYALLDVGSAWAQSLQDTGLRGMNSDNLIALHIFKASPEYIHSITALGYKMPDADQLIALRVQGVDPAEVKEIRSLGYEPTFDQLVQIRIFKITPEFIRRMQARGLKNLTLDKLIQIRIFKLDDD